jgi:hypothetical protein
MTFKLPNGNANKFSKVQNFKMNLTSNLEFCFCLKKVIFFYFHSYDYQLKWPKNYDNKKLFMESGIK